ncbi:AAA family ATPase [Leptotrichia wadei]|uniref:AAA family ATPase n=1 Tax=Leptotrichia wadei TaxID=157687 RepID=UPI00352DCD25
MITNNIAFDFERITSYLRDYSGKKYEDPKKAGNRMNEMEKFKEAGKKAREEFIAYANYIAESLDYKAGKCSGWIYQSQIACTYFWIELKKNEALKLPHSISISINIHPEHDINGPITLSFKVEAKDNACEDLDYKIHNKIIDVPIKKDSKIYYQTDLLNGTCRRFDNNTIELEKIKKLKVVRDIIGPYEKSNASKIIKDSIEAAKELVPFYEYILSERELRLSKNVEEEMKKIKPELNTILYGPPGTGKTYNTVNYAVAICENKNIEDVQSEEYEKVLHRYNELKKEGRIAFTTFHQSFGYEEFIEGIKPIVGDEKKEIGYTIEAGIFKKFCITAAKKAIIATEDMPDVSNAKVWCVLLDKGGVSDLKKKCFEEGNIRIGWYEQSEIITDDAKGLSDKAQRILLNFQDEMEIGDVIVTERNAKTIDGIGVVIGDYEYDKEDGEWPRKRKVKWLMTGTEIDITELNDGIQLDRKTVYQLGRISSDKILNLVNNPKEVMKPFVFVIDEINRGNISKIFGEMITLIEDTKREGKMEQASAVLPYSGELFSVPSNVYILGTMNTADRSIALMDTALRRRFQFVEMMPDTDILKNVTVEGVEIAPILKKINERITFLYDREHTIGHAFFIKLIGSPNINTLGSIFERSIIPLLQEYFYEDYQKIQLVLGDNHKVDVSTKFIKDEEVKVAEIFKGDANDIMDLPEKKYTINKKAFLNIESYKQIL